ncbi:LysR family transcriptional regulator [Kitasatospora phosalacinea]|uniref:LysR family transcriptional regulator n=1 Tax=Kitasatospora phosalacinea TaxID=2065 RepID=UPI0005242654|nr:LysR family transcriptional regulator [Kitasatospora phosalacinea]
MLDLSRLRTLRAVAVHGSISGAAAALGYTPSAVSQQIAKLERETRTTLLERHARGVTLTGDAEHLVAAAGQLLAVAQEAEARLEERRGRPSGTLTVASSPTAVRGLLPGALAKLTSAHPDLTVRTIEALDHACAELVAQGVADLGLAHDAELARLPVPSGLERTLIGEDPVEVCLPAAHSLAPRTVLSREDLVGVDWITPPPGAVCHDWVQLTMRGLGHEPVLAHQASEAASQLALVAAGLGVVLVGRLGRGPLPDGVVSIPLEPAPMRQVHALWRSGTGRRPAVTEALRLLLQEWRDLGYESAGRPTT